MNYKNIDYQLLDKNLARFSHKKVCAMVKADAYGLGVENIVSYLKDKVDFFGVSSIVEAEEVRKYCENKILIASKVEDLDRCKRENFHFIVDDFQTLDIAKNKGILDFAHIKLNLGMNRFGFNCEPQILQRLRMKLKNEKIGGICAHFQDLNDKKLTKNQYKTFIKVKKFLSLNAFTHFGGSEVINYDFDYDMIRVGIGLYAKDDSVIKISSNIIEIREVKSGSVGYNQRFIVDKPTKIGLVPIGYADGLARVFTGTYVNINGYECKIIGNICMDLCFVDVTNIDVKVGDEVIFLENIRDICRRTNLSKYEILTGFSKLRKR